jgi:AcrR family transcriptional regulator
VTTTTASPVDPRVARSRATILSTAAELMVESGAAAVTIEAISQRSGVARTTIYRHWPTRNDLLADAWSAASPPVEEAPGDGDLFSRVRWLAGSLTRRVSTPPLSLMLIDLHAAAQRDPGLNELRDHLVVSRRKPILAALTEAVATGELPAHTDPHLISSMIVGPILARRMFMSEAITPDYLDALVEAALIAARHCPPPPKRPRSLLNRKAHE